MQIVYMQWNWVKYHFYAEIVLHFWLPFALIIFDGKNSSVGMSNASPLFIVQETYMVIWWVQDTSNPII